jgi:histidinol dehydrogenase
MIITPTKTTTSAGQDLIQKLLDRFQEADTGCRKIVTEILAAVRKNGDEALLEYIRKFDSPDFHISQLKVTQDEFDRAQTQVDNHLRIHCPWQLNGCSFFMSRSWKNPGQ